MCHPTLAKYTLFRWKKVYQNIFHPNGRWIQMGKSIANGVWPVMITPFTEDNKIDWDGVLELIQWYEEQKVQGIFSVCQSSEMFFLSWEERLALVKFIKQNLPKHMGLIASGHVEPNLVDQVSQANTILETGIDSYVFISNQFARQGEDDEVAKKRIEELITQIEGESFGVYECPYPYKRLLSPELLSWCAQTGKFGFLKDTCCNVNELKVKLAAVHGTDLKIYNANAATLLESLKMGASGYSGVMANFHASLYVWLCAHYKSEPETAKMVQDLLGMASIVECQYYPVNAKYHLQLEGLNVNLFSRVQDFTKFTSSRRMEVEQLRSTVNFVKNALF